jgi:hypothetical protein
LPIVLADTKTPKTLDLDGASITYYAPGGDRVLASIRRGARRAPAEADREDLGIDVLADLAAQSVADWTGVTDAQGTPIPWPDAGRVVGVPGVDAPSSEALMLRRGLLRLLPWSVLVHLDGALDEAHRAGAESGKDSTPGSGG